MVEWAGAGADSVPLPADASDARAGGRGEEVQEHVRNRDAARVVARLLAVERRNDVVGAERQPGAGADRLLEVAGVDAADEPPLPVERHDPLLRAALEEHE